jgi:hypothetical protein
MHEAFVRTAINTFFPALTAMLCLNHNAGRFSGLLRSLDGSDKALQFPQGFPGQSTPISFIITLLGSTLYHDIDHHGLNISHFSLWMVNARQRSVTQRYPCTPGVRGSSSLPQVPDDPVGIVPILGSDGPAPAPSYGAKARNRGDDCALLQPKRPAKLDGAHSGKPGPDGRKSVAHVKVARRALQSHGRAGRPALPAPESACLPTDRLFEPQNERSGHCSFIFPKP